MNPADSDIENADALREALVREALRDDDAEAVVATKDVAHARDEDPHVREDKERMPFAEDAIRELEERIARHPVDRYPVQHATAQFHLGTALTSAGRLGDAETALATAVQLFDPERLPVEHAKALNALGAVLRLAGRAREAADVFERAATVFAEAGRPLEQGAALFNLGLVRREAGKSPAAAFTRARGLLDPTRVPAQAAAAARELGTALLTAGELDEAADVLEHALALAERIGDPAEAGAAANALGLAQLAAGRTSKAIASFRRASVSHPRTIRPHEYAMVKANLALAHERATDEARARLAARQAAGVPGAPRAAMTQAAEVLDRLGRGPGTDDLLAVLDSEPCERRPALVREELLRWADAQRAEQEAEARAWIAGQLGRGETGPELAEAWLAGLLELPPGEMEALIASTLRALGSFGTGERERFRSQTTSAMSRFHAPQLIRLRDTFVRLAAELDGDPWE